MNNNKLRQQLEEAQSTSNRLMEDIHQLTARWNESQLKLREKEAHWQESFEVKEERRGEDDLTLFNKLKSVWSVKSYFGHIALMLCMGFSAQLAEVTDTLAH